MIFTKSGKSSKDFSGYKEPIYDFLNRSYSKEAEYVRKKIEEWFFYYPIIEQSEFITRIQTNDDQEFISALFELYIHEISRQLGFKITVHPELDNDNQKRPDFSLYSDDEDLIVESTTTNELSPKERKAAKIINIFLDRVNKIESSDYFISINPIGSPSKAISGKKLIYDLERWLASSNYEVVEESYRNGNYDQITKTFISDEINFEITILPKYKNRGKVERLIGSHMEETKWVNSKGVIRRAISKKTTRYGDLGKPFLLAINVLGLSCDKTDVMEALFGSEKYIYRYNENEVLPPIVTRENDGKISKKINTRMSGVMIVENFNPWNMSTKIPTLFLNPWAKYPYKGKLLNLPHYLPENGVMKFIPGKDEFFNSLKLIS